MEAIVLIICAVVFFVGGVVFGRRHAAKIEAELAEAKIAAAKVKARLDELVK